METIKNTYNLLWKLIIRPNRDVYAVSDLGPVRFTMDGAPYERVDVVLRNDRGQRLQCSHYRTLVRRGAGAGKRADLLGWIRGSRDGAGGGDAKEKSACVIYLHGNCSSRLEAIDVLPLLLPRNISVFCLDLSGSGQSDGEYISLGYYEQQDLRVAIDHLRSSGQINAIGLWGRSMGAATSVLRAGEDPEIAACVLDSAFSSLPMVAEEIVNRGPIPVPRFMLNMALEVVRKEVRSRAEFDICELLPIDSAPRALSPALFATAEDDTFILPHHTQDLYDAWGGEERIFLTFDGGHGGHRPDWFRETAATFLEKNLTAYANGDRHRRREVLKVPEMDDAMPEMSAKERGVLLSGAGKELTAMGFSDEAVVEALQRHPRDAEAAVSWILDVSAQAQQQVAGVQLTAPSTNRDLRGVVVVAEDSPAKDAGRDGSTKTPGSLVQELVSLGFTEEQAARAAKRCSSVEAAVEWLAEHE